MTKSFIVRQIGITNIAQNSLAESIKRKGR